MMSEGWKEREMRGIIGGKIGVTEMEGEVEKR